MITVSSREFRSNQKNYLDQVAQGRELLVTRKNEAFKVTKVATDDTLVNKEDFLAQIERAIADVREGRTYAMMPNESLDDFLRRMETEGHV
ncbi:MAG: type II toxin-antitoxin system Phd/YefM family antitoxin [Prevotellaceae bacterium]|jgi:antitoxin (DNA-binding transcriptional repressor) of toxin-antitoxin stability system|nr:type II toxin-antitoxin system Phd/YefM family antitoxin [Prevotellaceae bacterium]